MPGRTDAEDVLEVVAFGIATLTCVTDRRSGRCEACDGGLGYIVGTDYPQLGAVRGAATNADEGGATSQPLGGVVHACE